ncbi:MAG: protein phosphatase 2C domain-containing protein [Polyangiaceae bacterium]
MAVTTLPLDPPPPPSRVGGRIVAAGATDVGRHRSRNEDQFAIVQLRKTLSVTQSSMDRLGELATEREHGTLLVVADGMGGHNGGDVASRVAATSAIRFAHSDENVRGAAGNEETTRKMGTTLTLAYLRAPRLYLAHVGDSRAYLLRGGDIHCLTRDHTVAEEMADRLDEQVPIDSRWHHVLTRALGGASSGDSHADVSRHTLQTGDVVLVCSDGLTNHVDEATLWSAMARDDSCDAIVADLVSAANDAGGTDNITVVVARFLSEE